MTDRTDIASKLVAVCDILGISLSQAADLIAEAGSAPEHLRQPVPTVSAFLPLVEAATNPGARRTYATYWRRLVAVYGDRLISEVRTSDLERLRIELPESELTVRRCNWRSGYQAQRTAVQSWRKFWAVAVADGLVADNPASRCPMEHRKASGRRGLSREEVSDLYEAAASGGNDPELDCLLIRICLETGARRAGVIDLTRGSVNEVRQTVMLREKGNQLRELPMTRELTEALLAHSVERGSSGTDDPLLLYKTGQPLTRRRFNTLFERLQDAAPFPDAKFVSAHWLRHTAITWVERVGGEAVAAAFAGHLPARSRVTGLYTTAPPPEVVAAWCAVWNTPHPLVSQPASAGKPSPN